MGGPLGDGALKRRQMKTHVSRVGFVRYETFIRQGALIGSLTVSTKLRCFQTKASNIYVKKIKSNYLKKD